MNLLWIASTATLATAATTYDDVFSVVPWHVPLNWCEGGIHATLTRAVTTLFKNLVLSNPETSSSATLLSVESLIRDMEQEEVAVNNQDVSLEHAYNLFWNLLSIFQTHADSGLSENEKLATGFCRVIDKEVSSSSAALALACFGQDLAISLTTCSVVLRDKIRDMVDCHDPPLSQNPPGAGVGPAQKASHGALNKIPGFPMHEQCHHRSSEGAAFPQLGETFTAMEFPLNFVKKTFKDAVPHEVRDQELLSYLALWRASVLAMRGVHPKCLAQYPQSHLISELVPGWHTLSRINLSQLGREQYLVFPPRASVPSVFVLRNQRHPCKLLVVFRGSLTDYEWMMDFQYHKYPTRRPQTFIHFGVLAILNSFADTLRIRIQEALQHCTCSQSEVIFSGHSLGGALSTASATLFNHDWETRGCRIRFYSVAFSSPRTVDGLDRGVVYRSLVDRNDMLYSLPCFHGTFKNAPEGNGVSGWPRCGLGHGVSAGVGYDSFPTPWGRVVVDTRATTKAVSGAERRHLDKLSFSTKQAYDGLLSGRADDEEHRELETEDPFNLLLHAPTRNEIVFRHMEALACALSSACRKTEQSKFLWHCEVEKS